MLKFSKANAKTRRLMSVPSLAKYLDSKRKVYSFDLPAGYTCPGADRCFSRCVKGKIKDGPNCQFRCFSATQEVAYPAVHKARKYNLQKIKRCKTPEKICSLIEQSVPRNCGIIRLHVSGDFYSTDYLAGWILFAEKRPDILIYTYTKSLHLFEKMKFIDAANGILLPNFLITASIGGKFDSLIDKIGIRWVVVVYSEIEAQLMQLEIDHSDEHAATPGNSFSLLIHGIQPKNSIAGKYRYKLMKEGKGGYTRV